MLKRLAAASVLGLLTVTACKPAPPSETPQTPDTTQSPSVDARTVTTTMSSDFGPVGLKSSELDASIAPGDDFYRYMNGKWLDSFDIPADRSRYGVFTMLAEMSEQRVRYIIEDLANEEPDAQTLEGKVAAYFNAYMDTNAIEQRNLTSAQPYLDAIQSMETREDLARLFSTNGYSSPVAGWVDVDSKNTDDYIFYFNQGGLGLGDRDYYLVDSEKNLEIREAYTAYLAFLLTHAGYGDGDSDAFAMAQDVYDLEAKIAAAHWDRAVGRNRNLTHNLMTRAELESYAGDFPLPVLLEGMGLQAQESFVVRQVTPSDTLIRENGLVAEQVAKISGGGVAQLFTLANTEPLEIWKAYLTAHFLTDHADVLPAAIDEATFDFFGKTLRGQEEQRDRWKRAVAAVEGAVGEAVGKVYAARYFPPENKAAMDELVSNLRKAMAANLNDIDWMGEATKIEARQKLSKFTPKIGYTRKFETYDTLTVTPDDAFANMMAATQWAWDDMISQLGQPIDKTEWFMLPQTVNAYYSPNRNEIVFPAAILQPPFFNIGADPAVNYGAIGGVIGHEIGHGFDDQGAKSDGDGVLRNWWTPEDEAAFRERTQALIGQYNAMCPLDDGETCVNGALTLGENIGDIGGLSMAYRAYRMSLNGEEAPVIDGLTGDQRFFLSWAQVWRAKYREEAAREQLVRDPHSPPMYRVNAVVRNFDAWYDAFNVGPDHALYLPPEQRIRIW